MADGEEGEDDDFDETLPPDIAGMRVWTNPGGGPAMSGTGSSGGAILGGPPTEDERRRFNIPGRLTPTAAFPADGETIRGAEGISIKAGGELRVVSESPFLGALVNKFPDFNVEWGPEIQSKWFEAFDKLCKMGAR